MTTDDPIGDVGELGADSYETPTDEGNGENGKGGGGASYNLPYLPNEPLWSESDIIAHVARALQVTGTLSDLTRNYAGRRKLPTDRLITVAGLRRWIPLGNLHEDPHAREWIPRQDLYLHLLIPIGSVQEGDIILESQEKPEKFDVVPKSLVAEPPAANGGGKDTEDPAVLSTSVEERKEGETEWGMSTRIGLIAPPKVKDDDPTYDPLPPGFVLVARPQRLFIIDGMKPERSSRGTTGRNLVYKLDVAAYLEILIDIEGLEIPIETDGVVTQVLGVYDDDAYDSASDKVRWRVRQLYWEARKWAMQGPPNWIMGEWVDKVPADHDWGTAGDPSPPENWDKHDNWRRGSFCFGYINDRFRAFLQNGGKRNKPYSQFYQMVPSEYFDRWQFAEQLALNCRAVEGQSVQDAMDAYLALQDMFSVVDRGALVEKLVMCVRSTKEEDRDPQTGEFKIRTKRPYIRALRDTASVRYCTSYEVDDDNKAFTGFNQWLEQRHLMAELSMPPGKPVSARGEWYGSALRDQNAGDMILQAFYDRSAADAGGFLDPRFYLWERLGEMAIQDYGFVEERVPHKVFAGPQAFLHHSNLLLKFVDSAKRVADLGLSAAGGMLTMDAVEKAAGDMVEWGENLIRVYKGVGENNPERDRYFSTTADGRELVAIVHNTDEAYDIDPRWVIERDSLFYETWPERMAGGWWEMGFPSQLGIDTQTWGNYGLHRTLARAVWWLQPVEPIRRALTFVIAEAKENRETDLLGIFLRRVAGFPSGEYGRHDIEEMHWEFREDIFEWMEDRMAEQHNLISLRQFRDFMSWYAKGMWQRIGDSPEARMKGMKRLKQLAFWLYMSAKAGDNMQGDAEEDDFRGRVGQHGERIARHLASRGEPWDIATKGQDREDLEEWQIAERREIAFRLRNAGLLTCAGDDLRKSEGPVPQIAEKIRATQPANPDDLEAWEVAWEEVREFITTKLPKMELTDDDVDFHMIRSWYYTFHDLLVVEPPKVVETVV